MNLIKLFYRKQAKNKFTAGINIVGLSLSFGIAFLLFIYVNHELSFDKFHENKDRIVRIVGKKDGTVWTGPKLGEELKSTFPEIENYVRSRNNEVSLLSYNERKHIIKANMLIDSSIFNMFNFSLISGDKRTVLIDPFSIVLTENIAKNIFGNKNPIGETVKFNNRWDYTVTGILKDLPDNSTIDIDILFPFHALEYQWKSSKEDPYNVLNEKYNQSFHTYLLFKKGADIKKEEVKICQKIYEDYRFDAKFQMLEDIYFDSNVGDRWLRKGNKPMTFILFSIAIGLILISIFNYINLGSVSAINNISSLEIRKTVGANNASLAKQAILENFIYLLITCSLGFGITYILNPILNNILNTNAELSVLFNVSFLPVLLGAFILLLCITSIFPLSFISNKVASFSLRRKRLSFKIFDGRNILVPAQFVLTIIFIVAALLINKQMHFVKEKNLGFSQDQLLYITMDTENNIDIDLFKNEIGKIPNVNNVSISAGWFGDIRRGNFTEINNQRIHFNRIYTDENYVETLGYEIIEGRNFQKEFPGDFTENVYIINETMGRVCEFKSPLEEKINGHRIVGVVKDFHILPLQSKITPIALVCNPERANWIINVKLEKGNLKNTMKNIENAWNKVSPDFPMQYTFADDRIVSYYQREEQFSKLAVIFSIISVILSCVGLIGLVMFTIQYKIQEIGIRRVNGAEVSEILMMLNTSFIKWIISAIIIACPLAYIIMQKWLENFAYKTSFNWWIFALSGLITMLIALFTVSFQSWQAARRNPVDALRYE